MFFYCFEFDEDSKNLCTINTPYGFYWYTQFRMGVKVCPDFAQETIEHILDGLDVEAYIKIWTNRSYQDHLKIVDQVLDQLCKSGLKVNPLKCKQGVQESDFLGHWMTPTSVKPMKKKIEAILIMDQPKTRSKARSFLGSVNF